MDVQTRCRGHFEDFVKISDAYTAWTLNPDIEKISWTTQNGLRQIWRPFKKGSLSPEEEAHLCNISDNYMDTAADTDWWFKQPDFGVIQEVTTSGGFQSRFCK
jgi:hypothetical protein